MTEIQSVVMGLLQGTGEFLPISSSAHLALAPRVFRWEDPGLAYDVMLHVGTLLAVLVYFAKDWVKIFGDAIARPREKEGRLLWLLAAGTLPGGVMGLLFNHAAETAFRDPRWIACNLIFFSLLIWWADRKPAQTLGTDTFTLKDALLIGSAQALAILPGASRSGMTIMAALFLGYGRGPAARLSFLLSTPIILGAALMEARKIGFSEVNPAFLTGLAVSFLSGLAVIGLFLAWLKKRTLTPFLAYRVILGTAILWMFWGNGR